MKSVTVEIATDLGFRPTNPYSDMPALRRAVTSGDWREEADRIGHEARAFVDFEMAADEADRLPSEPAELAVKLLRAVVGG